MSSERFVLAISSGTLRVRNDERVSVSLTIPLEDGKKKIVHVRAGQETDLSRVKGTNIALIRKCAPLKEDLISNRIFIVDTWTKR